jgi:hypothetical protein
MADIKFSQFTAGGNSRVGDIVVGLRGGDNVKFTFPGTGIEDVDGNFLLGYTSIGATAVNYINVANAATTLNPTISAVGSDTNIDLQLSSKGTGSVFINGVTVDYLNNISSIVSATFPGSGSGNALLRAQATAGTPTVQLPTSSGILALTSEIPGGGGVFWSTISGTTQTATVNTGWIPTNVGLTTITLPSTAAIGSVVSIQGEGSGGWTITAPDSQIIHVGSTATSAGGTVSSANRYDAITLVCIVADTEWGMYGPVSSGFVTT